MYKYKIEDKQYIGKKLPKNAVEISNYEGGPVYYEYSSELHTARGQHIIHDEDFIENEKETVCGTLSSPTGQFKSLINAKRLVGLNQSKISGSYPLKTSYRVNVLGLGDVGGIMLSGLRLLGGNVVDEIGIFDLDDNKIKRWEYELNQIYTEDMVAPKVAGVSFDEIFDCDAFVFTASSAIPEVGSGVKDVRMYQLEKNAKIIKIYAEAAADRGFEGQFIVVSDPVDLLCKAVLDYGKGKIKPEQIKGFGLGVMHARARFYADKHGIVEYFEDGRAFGPHGKHLIVANSMTDYNQDKSLSLTDMTIKANLDVRAVGYKPFIAPALSSAALSILKYLKGEAHYSTVYMDGVYFGCKNKAMTMRLFDIDQYQLTSDLKDRINTTVAELKKYEF